VPLTSKIANLELLPNTALAANQTQNFGPISYSYSGSKGVLSLITINLSASNSSIYLEPLKIDLSVDGQTNRFVMAANNDGWEQKSYNPSSFTNHFYIQGIASEVDLVKTVYHSLHVRLLLKLPFANSFSMTFSGTLKNASSSTPYSSLLTATVVYLIPA